MKSFVRQAIENWILDPNNRDKFESQLLEAIEKDDGKEFTKHNEIVVLLSGILAELKDMNNPAN